MRDCISRRACFACILSVTKISAGVYLGQNGRSSMFSSLVSVIDVSRFVGVLILEREERNNFLIEA